MSEAEASELLELIGDAGPLLAEALREAYGTAPGWAGASQEIGLVVQGRRIVEVKGAPPPPKRWKVLTPGGGRRSIR